MAKTAAQSIVAFLDILGFRELIATRIHDADYLTRLDRILRLHVPIFGGRTSLNRRIRTRMFSDCICVSAKVGPTEVIDFLFAVACFQRSLANQCIFTRGGIDVGLHFQTPRLIFSEGLVNAYALESKVARVPRVVVAGAVVDYASSALAEYDGTLKMTAGATLPSDFESLVWRDADGQHFVNYLSDLGGFDMVSSMFHQAWSHKKAVEQWIQEGVKQGLTESKAEKFKWLIAYHNKAILPFAAADDFLVDGPSLGLSA